MKFVILLALVVVAAAQHHRPDHDHGNPLHNLIYAEVMQIVQDNHGVSLDDCSTKCDALFDLNAGHDEEMTDRLCHDECAHQLHVRPTQPQTP